jgi:hypothetical protein
MGEKSSFPMLNTLLLESQPSEAPSDFLAPLPGIEEKEVPASTSRQLSGEMLFLSGSSCRILN